MPIYNDIDVRVLINGKASQEFGDPDEHDQDHGTTSRYIEARVDKRFKVVVKLLPGFDLRGARHVRIALHIDDQDIWKLHNADLTCAQHIRGVLIREYVAAFEHFEAKDEDGSWKRCFWKFGVLGESDEDPIRCGVGPYEVKRLGAMRVMVVRASVEPLKEIYFPDGKLPDIRDTVPEKLLKGRELKNNVKFDVTRIPAPAPSHATVRYVPLKGEAGGATMFVFKYRDRRILQHLGIIPRDPSPEPNWRQIAEQGEKLHQRDKSKITQMEARMKAMEAAMARMQLQNGRNIASTTDDSDDTLVEVGYGIQALNDDDDDEECRETSPPPKEPIEVIDLTEDD